LTSLGFASLRARLWLASLRGLGRGHQVGPAQAQGDEAGAGREIDQAHGHQHADQAQGGDQPVAGGQRSGEGAGGVEAIHQGVEAGGVDQAPGQGLGQDRDGGAHQHGRGTDQEGRERDVEGEAQAAAAVGDEEGDGVGGLEEAGKEQRVGPNAGLDESVEAQQARRAASRAGAGHAPPGHAAEQRVAEGQAAEEQPQHRGGGLAVGAQQRGQVLLPADLVDQGAEAGQPS
jgi:hypothetical protein